MASLLYHDVAPSGEDFTSLDAAIDHLVASHADFVTADVYGEVEIKGDWSGGADTTVVHILGLTLDATRYLSIYTNASNRAGLSWDANKYRLSITDNDVLGLREDYIRVDGLQIETSGATADYNCGIFINGQTASANEIRISRCLLRGGNTNTYAECGIYVADANSIVNIWLCAAYNFGQKQYYHFMSGLYVATNAVVKAYSSVFIGGTGAVYAVAGATLTCKNCYAKTGSSAFDAAYTNVDTMITCASSDTSGTAGLQNIAYGTDTFVNVTGGSEDFHLAADGLSPLQDAGTDTSGEGAPLNFTTDIDGDTIVNWSIGADDGTSAAGYTLACDGGSYTLTGQAMSPLRAAKVDAVAGEYALAGQDAGAYYGRAIDADGGAYTLTGQDIAALVTRLISADSGGYVLTGQDAATLFGRKLAAESGSYAVTGADVTLLYVPGGGAYVITAEGGTYAITGADAGLLRNAKLDAEAGAYVITGQEAATLLGRLLDAGAGAYALTGQDAALLRAAKIAIEAGAYAVTGADATLSLSTQLAEAILKLLRPAQRIVLSPAVPRIVDAVPAQRIVLTDRSDA